MKITIKNRLSALIRLRGLRSASEFARRMTEAGFKMSVSHATRFEKEDMPSTDLRFVNAVCNVLQCLPHSLYDIQIELEQSEELDPTLNPPAHAVIRRIATGGPQTALPVASLPVPVSSMALVPPPLKTDPVKAKSSPTNRAVDPDTGPKLTIFPYLKK